ncbi:EGF-like domain protein [Trichuris suis]|nr:EGF-like domain protein [Trichuris suis]
MAAVKKMPERLRDDWGRHVVENFDQRPPNLRDLSDWLEMRREAAEAVAMSTTYWVITFIVSIAVLTCNSYPQPYDRDESDCLYYFWRNIFRLDFPMGILTGDLTYAPFAPHMAPFTLCSAMTPEGRTIGYLWPTGKKTLCSSHEALEHIWSQTKSTANRNTSGRLFTPALTEKRDPRRQSEVLVNGYVIMKINSTESREVYNVAYKLIEAVNVTLMRHFVHNKVVVKPDLALFYNLTDLEYSSKEHLETGERIIVALHNDRLYYTHENKMRDLMRMLGERLYQSFCTYSNYMNYCAEKERDGTVLHTSIYPCKKCRPDADECAQEIVRVLYIIVEDGLRPHWSTYTAHEDGINNCSVHSKCENTFGSYKCICHDGWRGIYCNEDIDECSAGEQICGGMASKYIEECKCSPCLHGGLCVETYGNYTCQCPQGWNGHNYIDECVSNPCQNQGECTNTDGSFSCKCPDDFTGQACEITATAIIFNTNFRVANSVTCIAEIDACKSLKCEHGFCTGKGDNALCQCYGQWKGSKCNEADDMCKREDTCINGGTCEIDALMNFTCRCLSAYNGEHCEIGKKDRCLSHLL